MTRRPRGRDDHPQAEERALEEIPPSQPLAETSPTDILVLNFQAPLWQDNAPRKFKSPRVWHFVGAALVD